MQLATLYKSISVLQNPCWDILKKCAVSAMIEVQKKENHRRTATSSHVERFNRTCWKQGGYFFAIVKQVRARLLKIIDRIYTNILRTLCESVIIKTEKENPSLAAASSHGYEIHRSRLGRRGGFSFAA